jgi:hypothetical protein
MNRQKPFFAKFLENQLPDEARNNVKGGDCIPELNTTTRKAPSDWEDGYITNRYQDVDIELEITLKAPSDCEEG